MKVVSSSPYATFNSKEWKSLVSISQKYDNTSIKIKKNFNRTFTFKKIAKDNIVQENNELHKQMQLVFI